MNLSFKSLETLKFDEVTLLADLKTNIINFNSYILMNLHGFFHPSYGLLFIFFIHFEPYLNEANNSGAQAQHPCAPI